MSREFPPRFPDSIPEVYMQYRRIALRQLRTTMDVRVGFRHPMSGDLKRGADQEGIGGTGQQGDEEPRYMSYFIPVMASRFIRHCIDPGLDWTGTTPSHVGACPIVDSDFEHRLTIVVCLQGISGNGRSSQEQAAVRETKTTHVTIPFSTHCKYHC
jgi:hypothetical protein